MVAWTGVAVPPAPAAGAKPAPKPKGAQEAPPEQTVIEVQGLYLLNDRGPAVVDEFVTKLGESELYKVEPQVREVQNETDLAFRYTLTLVLKQPIAFKPTITSKEK